MKIHTPELLDSTQTVYKNWYIIYVYNQVCTCIIIGCYNQVRGACDVMTTLLCHPQSQSHSQFFNLSVSKFEIWK
jgi:hypothetical protein